MEVIVKKCHICKNTIICFNDQQIECCDQKMMTLNANETDASFEKHIPNYEIKDNKVIVTVNHVMEEKHYIMWLMMVSDDKIEFKEFEPNDELIAEFSYVKNSKLYSMCNLHNLWQKDIK